MNDEQVFELVRAELLRARTKYPSWPQDIVHAAAIASEEMAEVIKAVNNRFWGHGDDTWADIQGEAIQAIAMLVRFLAESQDVDPYELAHNLVIQQEAAHGR